MIYTNGGTPSLPSQREGVAFLPAAAFALRPFPQDQRGTVGLSCTATAGARRHLVNSEMKFEARLFDASIREGYFLALGYTT